MAGFFEKYQLTDVKKSSGRIAEVISPEERAREKLLRATQEQIALIDLISKGQSVGVKKGDKIKTL